MTKTQFEVTTLTSGYVLTVNKFTVNGTESPHERVFETKEALSKFLGEYFMKKPVIRRPRKVLGKPIDLSEADFN